MATSFGTFTGWGLGMGLALSLRDNFSGAAMRAQGAMRSLAASAARLQRSMSKSMSQIWTEGALAIKESTAFTSQLSQLSKGLAVVALERERSEADTLGRTVSLQARNR